MRSGEKSASSGVGTLKMELPLGGAAQEGARVGTVGAVADRGEPTVEKSLAPVPPPYIPAEKSTPVLADGSIGKVSVIDSSGFPRLDEAAIDAAKRSRFSPAKQRGVPIASIKQWRFRFSLESASR